MEEAQSEFFVNWVTVSLLLLDRLFYYSFRILFVFLLYDKLDIAESNCVVIFHGFQAGIYASTIFYKHIIDQSRFKCSMVFIMIFYLGGIGLLLALMLYSEEKTIFLAASLTCLCLGCGGIRAISVDFLDIQFEEAKPKYFGHLKRGASSIILLSPFLAATLPFVMDSCTCFGYSDCYWLYLSVVLLIFFILACIFILTLTFGKHHLIDNGLLLERNFLKVFIIFVCPVYYKIKEGISRKLVRRSPTDDGEDEDEEDEPKRYLDYAKPRFTAAEVDSTRKIWRICHMMPPLIFFWACIEQQASRWLFSGYRTDRRLGLRRSGYYAIHPSQFQVIPALVFLIFLPLLDFLVFPFLSAFGITTRRKKIAFAGMFIFYAMLIAGMVAHLQTDPKRGSDVSQSGEISTSVLNGINSKIQMSIKGDVERLTDDLDRLGGSLIKVRISEPIAKVLFSTKEACKTPDIMFATKNVSPLKTETIFIRRLPHIDGDKTLIERNFHTYKRAKDFRPRFRIFFANKTKIHEMTLYTMSGIPWMPLPTDSQERDHLEVDPGFYRFALNTHLSDHYVEVEFGAFYDVVVFVDENTCNLRFNERMRAIRMRFYWLIPQFILIAFGELMFGIPAVKFFLSQENDPAIRQTILMFWYLTIALGNVLVIAVSQIRAFYFFDDYQFVFCAMMAFAVFLFFLLAHMYTPRPGTDDPTDIT